VTTGRVGYSVFAGNNPKWVTSRNGFPCTETRYSPSDVLLRPASAPTKGRSDVYFADENLGPDMRLPDSELLKAVHAYSSDFYSRATPDGGKGDFRSLDETALIALGLLLEETAAQVLGDRGDMALVEPEGFDTFMPESRATQMQIHGQVPRIETPPYMSESSSDDAEDEGGDEDEGDDEGDSDGDGDDDEDEAVEERLRGRKRRK
jgi:hypothetical protein